MKENISNNGHILYGNGRLKVSEIFIDGEYVRVWGDETYVYMDNVGKDEVKDGWGSNIRRVVKGMVTMGGEFSSKWEDGEVIDWDLIGDGFIVRFRGRGSGDGMNAVERGIAIGMLAGGLRSDELRLIEKGMDNLRESGGFLIDSDGGFNVKEAEKCVAGLTAMMLKDYFYFGEEMEKGLKGLDGLSGDELREVVESNVRVRKSRMESFKERVKLGSLVSSELKWMIERGGGTSDESVKGLIGVGSKSLGEVKVIDIEEGDNDADRIAKDTSELSTEAN